MDHSIAVALIVWHFTHDKKQALAGLFHDIATPVFKHCVDYLNGDFMTQESTEDLTTEIIKNSKEIMSLLKRDGIKIEEVDNYHIYPIAEMLSEISAWCHYSQSRTETSAEGSGKVQFQGTDHSYVQRYEWQQRI